MILVSRNRISKIILLIFTLIILIFYPIGLVFLLSGIFLNLVNGYILKYIKKAHNVLKKYTAIIQNTFLHYYLSINEKKYAPHIITILIAMALSISYLYYTYHYSPNSNVVIKYEHDDIDVSAAYPLEDYLRDGFHPIDNVKTIHYSKSIGKWLIEDEIFSPNIINTTQTYNYEINSEYGKLLIQLSKNSIYIYRNIEIEFKESFIGLSKINEILLDNGTTLSSILKHSIANVLKLNDQLDILNIKEDFYLRSLKVTIRVPEFMIGTTYPAIEKRFKLLEGRNEELILILDALKYNLDVSQKPKIRLEVVNPLLRNQLLHEIHKLDYLNIIKWFIICLVLIIGYKIRELFIEPLVSRVLMKLKNKQ